MQIQRGELQEGKFMSDIAAFITKIVKENNAPKPEFAHLFKTDKHTSEPLGECPRCGSFIREHEKGYFCDTHNCFFKLWKRSQFWITKKCTLTADIVTALLKDGQIALKGLYSEKTGRKYDATIILNDTGEGFVNFKMEFNRGAK
jgi:DNA topoisomerase-3